MRSLLDVREQYLNEFSFPDPYAEVKYTKYNINHVTIEPYSWF